MKVLQINCVYKTGSTGKIVEEISSILESQSNEAYVAYGIGEITNSKTYATESFLTQKMNVIKSRFLGKHGFYNRNGTKKLIRWINEVKPDIIHLHNLHGDYVNIDQLFKYIKDINIPIVWTLHDCWSFTGHCAYFDYVGCEKWKTGCGNCPQKRDYPISWFFDRSAEAYKSKRRLFSDVNNLTIVTPSNWLENILKESYLSEYNMKTIYNGIDLNVFKPTKSNFRIKHKIDDKFVVLGVANGWGKRKGLDVFIELSKILDERFQIVLVGTNNSVDSKLPKNVISIQRTNNQEELAAIYTAADLFVNPTREEVLGMVNIEANACGTKVITFDSGGSPECVNESSGIVVSRDDVKELKKAIMHAFNNQTDPYNCIDRAADFNKDEKFQEYIDLYHEVLEKN